MAAVSTAAGSRGKVTAVAPSYATISAIMGALTASVEVEVNTATHFDDTGLNTLSVSHGGSNATFRIVGF